MAIDELRVLAGAYFQNLTLPLNVADLFAQRMLFVTLQHVIESVWNAVSVLGIMLCVLCYDSAELCVDDVVVLSCCCNAGDRCSLLQLFLHQLMYIGMQLLLLRCQLFQLSVDVCVLCVPPLRCLLHGHQHVIDVVELVAV